jgi:polysaccharide export outer membrane protein
MQAKFLIIGLSLLLTACGTTPRGAGLEREILAGQDQVIREDGTTGTAQGNDAEVPADFAVEVVSSSNLAKYASWPAVGETSRRWINRVDQPNTRILAIGDTVNIAMWSTEDNGLLSGQGQRLINMPPQQISSNGELFLPYIGQIKVSGLSPELAREAVQTAYAKVSPSVQVQLAASEGRSNTASLLSGVNNPGTYPLLDQDFTLLDLIASAGGIDQKLINPQIRLQRGNTTYATSVNRLMNDTALNTTLQGSDRIFIENDERTYLALGATGTQSPHRFDKDRITALDAMSQIGGLEATRANAQGILILRTYPESAVRRDGTGPRHVRTIFTINLTTADGLFSAGQFQIRSGDVIYATESPTMVTRSILGMTALLFGVANQTNNF